MAAAVRKKLGRISTGKLWAGLALLSHTGGVNFLFGDGSVHNISNAIDGSVYEGLLTRAGGEAGQRR